MSFHGIMDKFLYYMKLSDDEEEEVVDFEVHNCSINTITPLPAGGFLMEIVNRDIDNDPTVGIVVISKNNNPSVLTVGDWTFDTDVKYFLVNFLSKFCEALKT